MSSVYAFISAEIILFIPVSSICLFSVPHILHRAAGSLEPIPGGSGNKMGSTLDRVPTHQRPLTLYTHTRHMYDKLQHVLGLEKKLAYPQKTPKACGEHANPTHRVNELEVKLLTLEV